MKLSTHPVSVHLGLIIYCRNILCMCPASDMLVRNWAHEAPVECVRSAHLCLIIGVTLVSVWLCSSAAFIHASGALGPVLGYALGALLLQYYVDSFSHEVLISAGHPQWIGAWWGGFIICGLLLLLLAFPFLGYPRVLVQEKRRLLENKTKEQLLSEDERPVDTQYGRSIKGTLL